MQKPLFIVLFLILTVFLAGCTDNPQPGNSIAGPGANADLHASFQFHGDYNFGLGCYERIDGYVYNAGSSPANDAKLYLALVNTETGVIRDGKVLPLGTIGPGDSRKFETTLDGECGNPYRVDGTTE